MNNPGMKGFYRFPRCSIVRLGHQPGGAQPMLRSTPNGYYPATVASHDSFEKEERGLLGYAAPHLTISLGNKGLPRRMKRVGAQTSFAREMALARRVQNKLFPQRMPPLETLDYAGTCEQAYAIGGDYYDFIDMGRGRVGLALGDVSGKGVYAALLMANLQASLRSQRALALQDLAGFLRSVNKLFYESMALGFFATLFFAEYSDATRTLRYVNCGHFPAFLVRANGRHEKLHSTATVLGLFEKWTCTVRDVKMSPGDILVMYSDGVTEARGRSGEIFGEERMLRTVCANASLPACEILSAIAASARKFGGEVQEDDLTLLVARAR